MNIVKLDLLDGLGLIEVAVIGSVEADKLRRFSIAACEAFNDQERWIKVSKLMTHEQSGNAVGWTLGIVLPGEDPNDAVDKAEVGK